MLPELPPSRHGAATPRVRVGHVVGEVGAAAAALGMSRALVVTDAGLKRTPWPDVVRRSLQEAGVEVVLHADAQPDPSSSDVARALRGAGEVDGLIGLGGGSSLDTAKAAGFLLANGGRMEDVAGFGRGRGGHWPLIAIPTTAGTGSEAQSFALITREPEGTKMACGDASAMPRVALLDPRLVASCPPDVARQAGLDALVHAVEAAVTSVARPDSVDAAVQAFGLLWGALPRCLEPRAGEDVWTEMLVGALLAGAAIEASMLGAAHATANALSACCGTPHGLAVAMTLPHVMRINGPLPGYDRLGIADLPREWEALLDRLGVPRTVGAVDVEALVAVAMGQWTRGFNPAPFGEAECRAVFRGVARG